MPKSNSQESVNISADDLKLRFMRERQSTALIITVTCVACLFLVCALIMVLSLFAAGGSKNTSINNDAITPCIPFQDQKAVNATTITVRVLNASGLNGFGSAVSKALEIRGFHAVAPEGYNDIIERTEIHFGANAIAQAYTLADNFNKSTLVLDDRTDGLIDIVIGRDFEELKDRYLVMTSNLSYVLPNPDKCKTVHDITPVPALEHDASLVAAYSDVNEIMGDTVSGDGSAELGTIDEGATADGGLDEGNGSTSGENPPQ